MFRPTLFSTLLVSLVCLTGCGKKSGAPTEADTAAAQGILLIGNGTEPQDLDPQVVTGVPESKLANAFFEGLVSYGPQGNDTVPGAAESWDVSEDKLTYTFHLRAAARWSNGDPVTATDFVRSYQRILTPSLAAEYSYKLFDVVGAEAYYRGELKDFAQVGFSAPDPLTLVIRLHHRTPYFLEQLKHSSWFPVHIPTVEKFGGLDRKGSAWTRPGNLVGNGPFVLAEWKPNQRIIATRSPTYWDRDSVRLNAIHFFAVDDANTEERMFRTGLLHRTNDLPIGKIDSYRRDYSDVYQQSPYYGLYYFRINVTRPPFNDVRVRRAFNLALDRESLVKFVTRGGQEPAYSLAPPASFYTARARFHADAAEARRLLAEAGFPGGAGFPKVEVLYNTSENHRKICEALQEMWRRELGVEVSLVNQEWKVYLETMHRLDYQIGRAGWIGDYLDPHTFYDTFVTGGGNNDTGWSNAKYDQLLRDSFKAPTPEARLEIFQQMEEIFVSELPIIPIYYYQRICASSPRLHWPVNDLDNQNWKYIWFKN